jgi:uncharacterized membrane protein
MNKEKHIAFVKTTLIGGVVFLIPLVVIAVVVSEAIDLMKIIAEPFAILLPINTISDIALVNILAVIGLIIICFLAGLLARQVIAGNFIKSMESKVLTKIPGYTMIKGLASGLTPDEADGLKPVLLTLGNIQRFGLEIEKLQDGRSVVFTPSPPSVWTGITQIVAADQIQYVDVPVMAIMEYTEQYNRGTEVLLSKVIEPENSNSVGSRDSQV